MKLRIIRGNTGLYSGEYYSDFGNVWLPIPNATMCLTKLGCKLAIKASIRDFKNSQVSVVDEWEK
ncbi:MAG: hypothetical protein J5507_02870 [Clostridia bacterium]|nr:hypothetical protein [Clostridia bacterium]